MRRLMAPVLSLALLFGASGLPVLGTNFGSGIAHICDDTVYSQCVADNGTHTVYAASLTADWSAALNSAITVYNGHADLSVSLGACCSTDVVAYDFDYGDTGYWAWTACEDEASYGGSNPDRWCKPQGIYFNQEYTWAANPRKSIACHELGHSLGLRHSSESTSCMKYASTTNLSYTSHDSALLAGQY